MIDLASFFTGGGNSKAAWVKKLIKDPSLAETCDKFNKFSPEDWATVIQAHMELTTYAKAFPSGWATLLAMAPNAFEYCDIFDQLSVGDMVYLMGKQEEFADKFDKWDELGSKEWANLLSEKPIFADKCNAFDDFDSYEWIKIITKQEIFIKKCNFDGFDGDAWIELVKNAPQYADKCDTSKLDSDNWVRLIEICPEFIDKCKDFSNFSTTAWASAISIRPELAEKCDKFEEFEPSDWVVALSAHPELMEKCDISDFEEKHWVKILAKQPQLMESDEYAEWEGNADQVDYTDNDLIYLLSRQPQLLDDFSHYAEKMNEDNLVELLKIQPEITLKLKRKLSTRAKANLWAKQPQLAQDYNDWSEFYISDWVTLLSKQIQFKDKCAEVNAFKYFQNSDWEVLLDKQADLADTAKEYGYNEDNNESNSEEDKSFTLRIYSRYFMEYCRYPVTKDQHDEAEDMDESYEIGDYYEEEICESDTYQHDYETIQALNFYRADPNDIIEIEVETEDGTKIDVLNLQKEIFEKLGDIKDFKGPKDKSRFYKSLGGKGIFEDRSYCKSHELEDKKGYFIYSTEICRGMILEEEIKGTFDIEKLFIAGTYNKSLDKSKLCQKIEYDDETYDLDSLDVSRKGQEFHADL